VGGCHFETTNKHSGRQGICLIQLEPLNIGYSFLFFEDYNFKISHRLENSLYNRHWTIFIVHNKLCTKSWLLPFMSQLRIVWFKVFIYCLYSTCFKKAFHWNVNLTTVIFYYQINKYTFLKKILDTFCGNLIY